MVRWLAAVVVGAVSLGAWQWPLAPGEMPRGPLLQAAEQRQVLRVGVRSYPRPSLGQEALVAEPDELDSQLAEALGAYLGLKVQLQALPQSGPLSDGHVDLVIAGSLKLPVETDRVASLRDLPVQYRAGALIGLRNAPARPVRGQSVCLAMGSPWAQTLQQQGAELRTYVSSIRAAVAFMAGECNLLAEERNSLQALAQAPDWRFYALLPQTLKASSDLRVYLPVVDKQSRALINAALRDWQARGGQTRAWELRSNALLVDSLKIGDGLVCH